jgi:polyhydroxyalkanoate synthase
LSACVARIAAEDGKAPVLIGHSLGGTFAAIYAALDSRRVRGLVLVGAPVCFQPQSSTFRDAVDRLAPLLLMQSAIVPGSAISYLSALASPDTFIRSRLLDGVLSSVDRHAAGICIRVERWTLDEVALSGPMVRQVTQWLYREDRLCRGTLQLRNRSIGPSTAQVATLAVVNTADKIAPRAAVEPFLARMPERDVQLLEFAGEPGVGLQHVALLVGPRARVEVWPAIGAWIEAHSC